MNNENNIDKLFRSGLKGHKTEHAFNQSAWENMEVILNQNQAFSWLSFGRITSIFLMVSIFIASSSNNIIRQKQLIAFKTNNQTVEPSLVSNEKQQNNNQITGITTNDKDQLEQKELSKNNPQQIAYKSKLELANATVSNRGESHETSFINRIPNNKLNQIDLDNTIHRTGKFSEQMTGFDPADQSNLPKLKSQSISIFAGIGLENGLGSASAITASNILPTLGFYYNNQLAKNIEISTGIGYRTKSGDGIELSRSQTQYGFGKTVKTETLKLQKLHYIDLPVELCYNIKGKHSLIAGAGLSYLVGANSIIKKTQEQSLVETKAQESKTWAYKDGISNIDVALRFGYNYLLGKNLSIGGLVQYGLTDITSNETFEVVDKSKNLEVRVTLKYTPIRF